MYCKESFEVSPPPISVKYINVTVSADVVVVGAAIAGLTAALSAPPPPSSAGPTKLAPTTPRPWTWLEK